MITICINHPNETTDFGGHCRTYRTAWSDMSETQFAAYETKWQTRRQQAFDSREFR